MISQEKADLIEELLVDLQVETIKVLLERARSGEITGGEAGQVVQMCKLNNINIEFTDVGEVDAEVQKGLDAALRNEKILPFAREA